MKKSPSEHWEQVMFFTELRRLLSRWPQLGLTFAIPNGGLRNKITAMRLKDEGVKSGVPDIFIPIPKGRYHGAFIEMKSESGRTSQEQDRYIEALKRQGYFVEVCHGFLPAIRATEHYMSLEKNGDDL